MSPAGMVTLATPSEDGPNGSPHPVAGPRAARVFVTAAEVSGDRHAAQFIRSLRARRPDIVIDGIGGPEMEAAGAVVHRNTVTNAAMGWRGALRAGEIYKVLRWTRQRFDADPPDLWVGVDSPSMNFHFARAAKERGIPTLQYVAPQLWAWAPWRMKKLQRWVDRVACILPFEEAFFRRHGVEAVFVGHPLFDELPQRRTAEPGRAKFPDAAATIGLLPGSRRSVAAANFSRQLEAAAMVLESSPDARFVVPTTEATDATIRAAVAAGPLPADRVEIRKDAFDDLVRECDLCLTVSGTATLHVASFGVPMIVVYAGSPWLWNLVGRWLIRMRTFAMVNLLADPEPLADKPGGPTHLVPEHIPWCGSVRPVAEQMLAYLRNPASLSDKRREITEMVERLDKPGASDAVAKLAIEAIDRRRNPSRG